jgi:hypothetical protein
MLLRLFLNCDYDTQNAYYRLWESQRNKKAYLWDYLRDSRQLRACMGYRQAERDEREMRWLYKSLHMI